MTRILLIALLSCAPSILQAKVIEVKSRTQLNEEIKDANAIIKFYAQWCGPCKTLKPIFNDVSNQDEFSSIKFLAVDIDPHSDIADIYGVSGIPTMVVIKNGKESERLGSTSLEGLKVSLRRAFDLTAPVPQELKKKIEAPKEEEKPAVAPVAQEQKGIMHTIKKGLETIRNGIVDGFTWLKRKVIG